MTFTQREFAKDATGSRYAIHVAAFTVYRLADEDEDVATPPPWRGVPPPPAVYRERGHWRLSARIFQEKVLELHLGMPDAGRDDH